MAQYLDQPRARDADGNVLPGAKLYFYEAGDEVLLSAYADSDLSTPLPNPLIFDFAGRCKPFYLDQDQDYRLRLTDADGVEIFDLDPFDGVFPGSDTVAPLSDDGESLPFATLTFMLSETTQITDEYEADENGLFEAIELDDEISYRVRLKDKDGVLVYDVDPITPAISIVPPPQNLFVAVSSSGPTGQQCMTSPDGEIWTLRNTPTNEYYGIAYSPSLGLYVAPGRVGGAGMTSPDAITWTERSIPNNPWRGIAWSQELALFVAVGGDGLMTSPDGLNWTLRSVPSSQNWFCVIWCAEFGLFVAGGTSSGIITSPDGINWTTRSLAEAVNGLAFSGSRIVTCNRGNDSNGFSDDGIIWTRVSNNATGSGFSDIAYGGGVFSIVGQVNSATSADGGAWTLGDPPGNVWEGICYSPVLDIFVAVTSSAPSPPGGASTSPNGLDWTFQTPPTSSESNWQQVIAVNL